MNDPNKTSFVGRSMPRRDVTGFMRQYACQFRFFIGGQNHARIDE